MATPTQQQLDQANTYLKSGNYQAYADLATSAGYSPQDMANYASTVVPNLSTQQAMDWYNTQYKAPTTTASPSLLAPSTATMTNGGYTASTTTPASVTPTPTPATSTAPNTLNTFKTNTGSTTNSGSTAPTNTTGGVQVSNTPSYTTNMLGKNVLNTDLTAFNDALRSGNYTTAQTIAKNYGFSNQDIANYAGGLGINGITADNTLQWLNANAAPTNNPLNNFTTGNGTAPYSQVSPLSSLYNQSNVTTPNTSQYYNNVPQVNASGQVNIGTALNPYYVNPMEASGTSNLQNKFMTPDQYSLLQSQMPKPSTTGFAANNNDAQNQQIMDFAKANGITPEQAQVYLANQSQNVNASTKQVDPNSLSQNQLANMTSQDSPLMQLASRSGQRLASARGLLNSSISAGNAQAEMVKAAQPFALQDAQTNASQQLANQQSENQVNLANQAATNQVNLANAQTQNQGEQYNATNSVNAAMQAAQAGFDAAKQNTLQNNDTLNKADLAGMANQLDMNAAFNQGAITSSNDLNKANIDARQAMQTAILDRANANVTAANQADMNTTGQAQKNDAAVLQNQLTQNTNAQLASFDIAKANNQNYFDQWKTQFDASAQQMLQNITDNAAMQRTLVQQNTTLYQTDSQRQTALDQIQRDVKNQAITSSTNLMNTFLQQMQQIGSDINASPMGKNQTQLQIAAVLAPQLNQLNALAGINQQFTAQSLVNAWQGSQQSSNPTANLISQVQTG
jgi:hypothetical protein